MLCSCNAIVNCKTVECLQVTEILKYFSWAEPQIKAVKALQHVSIKFFKSC